MPPQELRVGAKVPRGDVVKDDSGSYTVFTEQGSSASQMTAAKVLDVIARPPGCAGQASDAVSAYTQVKMENAPTLLKLPKSECPDIWRRLPRYEWQKGWQNIEEPVVPYGKEFVRTMHCRFATESTVRKSSTRKWMDKSTNLGNVCSVHRQQGLCLAVYVGDFKMAGKKQNLESMWEN